MSLRRTGNAIVEYKQVGSAHLGLGRRGLGLAGELDGLLEARHGVQREGRRGRRGEMCTG